MVEEPVPVQTTVGGGPDDSAEHQRSDSNDSSGETLRDRFKEETDTTDEKKRNEETKRKETKRVRRRMQRDRSK